MTQKPIEAGESFTYKFKADRIGNLWYHCHVNVNEHVGIRVQRLGDLLPAMTEAFAAKNRKRLVFLDVEVDPEEHVYPMAIRGGSMRDMFLSRTETT